VLKINILTSHAAATQKIIISLEDCIVHSKHQLPAYFSIRDSCRRFLVEIGIKTTTCTQHPRDQYFHSSFFLNKAKSSQNLRGQCVASGKYGTLNESKFSNL
jgi:hypothetical protein